MSDYAKTPGGMEKKKVSTAALNTFLSWEISQTFGFFSLLEAFGVVFQHVAHGTYGFSQIEEPDPSCPRINFFFQII